MSPEWMTTGSDFQRGHALNHYSVIKIDSDVARATLTSRWTRNYCRVSTFRILITVELLLCTLPPYLLPHHEHIDHHLPHIQKSKHKKHNRLKTNEQLHNLMEYHLLIHYDTLPEQ